jgi:hypothetical protein
VVVNRGLTVLFLEVVESCSTVADVILVVDVSGSVGKENFKLIQAFLKRFLDHFDLTKGTRVGYMTYDDKCHQVYSWNTNKGKSKAALKKVCVGVSGSKRINRHLNFSLQQYEQQHSPKKKNKISTKNSQMKLVSYTLNSIVT